MSWRFGRRVYLLLRATIWLILTGLGTLADQYQMVDVQNVVRQTFANSTRLTLIVAGVTIAWLLILHPTRGQKGFSAKGDLNEGE